MALSFCLVLGFFDRRGKYVHLLCVMYYFTYYNSDMTNAK